ncbi:hypothetical protein ACIHEI_05680, partial [Kitasatospora sp. NPDC051984]|uniref:hypothetical protein n=1 Tax=Kitasatospora sp. NPDC051984 TaxID=3364059 RepID=UPI0037C691AE
THSQSIAQEAMQLRSPATRDVGEEPHSQTHSESTSGGGGGGKLVEAATRDVGGEEPHSQTHSQSIAQEAMQLRSPATRDVGEEPHSQTHSQSIAQEAMQPRSPSTRDVGDETPHEQTHSQTTSGGGGSKLMAAATRDVGSKPSVQTYSQYVTEEVAEPGSPATRDEIHTQGHSSSSPGGGISADLLLERVDAALRPIIEAELGKSRDSGPGRGSSGPPGGPGAGKASGAGPAGPPPS